MASADREQQRNARFLRARGRGFQGLGYAEHGGPERPFSFVQMADTQLGMEACFAAGMENREGFGWAKELELCKLAAAEVNRLRPAFCIVCGDLVDEWPEEEIGREKSYPEMRKQQEKDFKDVMNSIDEDIPLLCLCGNHDIGNRPNARTIKRYTDSFGDDYFSFWCHGVKCIVLNSQIWKDDRDVKKERDDMEAWLDKELDEVDTCPAVVGDSEASSSGTKRQKAQRRMMVFSHIAPFISRPDEEHDYFNLDIDIRQRWLAKMASKGVIAWFCGHYHRNAVGIYQIDDKQLEVVTTGAVGVQITDKEGGNSLGLSGIGGHRIGTADSGLRVVRMSPGKPLEHRWKTFEELRNEKPFE